MKLSRSSLPVALVAVLTLASCASAPSSVEPSPVPRDVSVPTAPSAPEWTLRTVFMEGSELVFVLSGPERALVSDLALQAMTSYLDLPIGPQTPLVAAQAVEKFLTSLSATPPSDRFTRDGKSWWKVAVSKDLWDQSRSKLKALFESTPVDPSVELERAAEELLRQGRYVDAVSGYVLAASATVAEGRTPQPARFRSLLGKAQDILSQFTLSSTTPSQTTQVGKPFLSTFDVRLTFGSGAQAPAVAAAPLRFSYKVKKNGRPAVTGQTIKTDANGVVSFEFPLPDLAARDNLVVLFDVNPWLEALVSAPKDLSDAVAGLETVSGERKLQLPYTVESASKQVPMFVSLADFDDKGTVLRRQETSGLLIASLQKAGFQTSSIPVNPTLLKSTNDSVILAAWKFQGKTQGRAVYGTVNLVSVTASGSQFNAEVLGQLKVVDLATSKPVYQLKSTKVSTAADKASATTLAFRQWAAEAASLLEAELP